MRALTRTGTIAVLVVWLAISAALWLGLEAWTLSDAVPQNHITAAMRWVWGREPWVVLWLMCSGSFLAGHFFARGSGE